MFLRLGSRSLEGMAHAPVYNVPQTGCSVGSFCCYSCWPLGVINYHLDPFLNRGTPCILGWVLGNLWAQRSDHLAKENEFHYLLAEGRFLKRWAGIKYRRKGESGSFLYSHHMIWRHVWVEAPILGIVNFPALPSRKSLWSRLLGQKLEVLWDYLILWLTDLDKQLTSSWAFTFNALQGGELLMFCYYSQKG